MSVIECKEVSKFYERRSKNAIIEALDKNKEVIRTVALNQVNFTVEKGDFTIIMGPSGSGKSTLLNNIATLDTPTSGDVIINGKKINKMAIDSLSQFRSKELGFIFQNFNVLPNLTISENIGIPVSILGDKNIEEYNSLIENIAKKVGVDHLLNKYPSECSGGQIQRVAIARALINEPDVILADEPTGNLDSKNSHEVLALLSELNKEGKTIVMVTHDNLIASYGKRVIFLRDGKIEEDLKKGESSQKEFFHEIVDANSRDIKFIFE